MSCIGASRLAFAICAALCACTAAAQDPAGELGEHLIALRSEVEQLNDQLELQRVEQRSTLAGLGARQAELQAGIDRQRLAVRELRAKLDAATQAVGEAGVAGEALAPLLHEAIAALETYVGDGLPFKREERLGEIAQLRTQLANGSVPPERAVNRLWALYEDEFRLTRDNSLHSQTIALGNERVLADVAKLGTVALYFRTGDERYGQALRTNDGWRFVELADAADIARTQALFDALGKQIRQGYFELPVAAAGAVP